MFSGLPENWFHRAGKTNNIPPTEEQHKAKHAKTKAQQSALSLLMFCLYLYLNSRLYSV